MKIIREFLWLFVATLLIFAILFPIESVIDYKYTIYNVLIIIFSVLNIRMILDYKTVTLLRFKWFKVILFSVNLFIFISIIGKAQELMAIFDTFSITAYSNEIVLLDFSIEAKLINYINTEILLSSAVAISSLVMLNIKMLKSFWGERDISEL